MEKTIFLIDPQFVIKNVVFLQNQQEYYGHVKYREDFKCGAYYNLNYDKII